MEDSGIIVLMTNVINTIKSPRVKVIVEYILDTLEDLGAWIYYISRYDSVYIKFANEELRSIRVADHKGRSKYRYKWNLELNGDESRIIYDRGVERHFYKLVDLNLMIDDIRIKADIGREFINCD